MIRADWEAVASVQGKTAGAEWGLPAGFDSEFDQWWPENEDSGCGRWHGPPAPGRRPRASSTQALAARWNPSVSKLREVIYQTSNNHVRSNSNYCFSAEKLELHKLGKRKKMAFLLFNTKLVHCCLESRWQRVVFSQCGSACCRCSELDGEVAGWRPPLCACRAPEGGEGAGAGLPSPVSP